MSMVQTLMVFGQVYFLNSSANIPLIGNDPQLNNSPLIRHIVPKPTETTAFRDVRRNDYTYTSGIGGHKVHTDAVAWNTARKLCEEEGAHLAIINSVAESKVIEELFRKLKSRLDSYLHIGFHDLYQEGEYVTIHGQSLIAAGFNEWHGNEPDNHNGNEHCGSVFEDGKLNDLPCRERHGFVCELPFVPENLITPQ